MRQLTEGESLRECDECKSQFIHSTVTMTGVCRECAHWLYGYDRCDHEFRDGCCFECGWDGSISEFVETLKNERS